MLKKSAYPQDLEDWRENCKMFHPRIIKVEHKNLRFQRGLASVFERVYGSAKQRLERAKGFEPSTPTLARLCSTPELRPRSAGGLYARTQCHDKPGRDVEPTIKTSFLHQKMVGLDKMARPAFKAPASP